MTPEQVLRIPPKVLTEAQREFYFSEGYLCLQRAIGDEWIAKLRAATDELIGRSRCIGISNHLFPDPLGQRGPEKR